MKIGDASGSDDRELSIGLPCRAPRSRSKVFALLVVGLMAATVIVAGTMLAVLLFSDPIPAHLVGSWHGTFRLPKGVIHATYIFQRSGRFQQEAFDDHGREMNVGGRCEYSRGRITIRFHGGSVEKAIITMVDENTLRYLIFEHDDPQQRGLEVTFRRQQ